MRLCARSCARVRTRSFGFSLYLDKLVLYVAPPVLLILNQAVLTRVFPGLKKNYNFIFTDKQRPCHQQRR